MKKNRYIPAMGAMLMVFAVSQSVQAQFFTNDLTDATSALSLFNTNCAPDGAWTFTNDYAIAQDGSTNTVLQGGAVLGLTAISNDADSARSYMVTVHSNYVDTSWRAHVAVETVNSDPKNYIFFGLGQGIPNPGYFNEPTSGDYVHLKFQSGNSGSKVGVFSSSGGTLYNSGAWQGDPGYDFWITYNHLNRTIQFELDNWNGGRFSDIDIDSGQLSVASLTNNMSIYFGGNATMTFGDFYVEEIIPDPTPGAPQNLYAWPTTNNAATVYWDTLGGVDGYNVYRSLDDVSSNYVQIASGITTNSYTDSGLTDGVTYYYKASATNASGEGDLSNSEFATASDDYVFGVQLNAGSSKTRWFYELFDGNLNTFCDDNAFGGYAGLDYGVGNSKQIVQVAFRLRNDSFGYGADGTLVIDGVTNNVTRSQNRTFGATFEGSNDGSSWTELAAITNIAVMGEWNPLAVTDATAYRYVRYNSAPSGWNNYAMADVEFYTAADFTSQGTLKAWLDFYYDVSGANPEGFADYEDADLSDTDVDGLKAYEEYQLGTDPTDPLDPTPTDFSITDITVAGSDLILTWESSAGQSFSVMTNSNLADTNAWGAAASGITGGDGSTSYTGTVSESTLFYQVTTP